MAVMLTAAVARVPAADRRPSPRSISLADRRGVSRLRRQAAALTILGRIAGIEEDTLTKLIDAGQPGPILAKFDR
jgi:hypothetical protein